MKIYPTVNIMDLIGIAILTLGGLIVAVYALALWLKSKVKGGRK